MTKSLYLFVSVLAGASLLTSCKSSSPSEVQTGQQSVPNLLRYDIDIENIPVVFTTQSHQAQPPSDTTINTNSLSGVEYHSHELLQQCDTLSHSDTARFCYSVSLSPYYPNGYQTIDTGSYIYFLLNPTAKTVQYLSFGSGEGTSISLLSHGGSDGNSESTGQDVTAYNIPYSQNGDTIFAEVHGAAINLKSDNFGQRSDRYSRYFDAVSSDRTYVSSVRYPLPDSAYIRLKLILKH
jgi:hypothetical protein